MTALLQSAFGHTIIRASAGSGKTTELSNRYIQLLFNGVSCESILATTFTRKAAGEILDRIMQGLAGAALNDAAAKRLAQLAKLADFDRVTAQRLLRHMLTHLHRLQVGTLDSFFAKLARTFSLEMGLEPDWEIADDRAKEQMAQSAVDAVLSREDTVGLLQLMAKGASIRGANQLMMDTIEKVYAIFLESSPGAWFQLKSQPVLAAADLAQAIDKLQSIPIENKRMAKARDDDIRRAMSEDWDSFITTGLAGKIVDGTNAFYNEPISNDAQEGYTPLIDHVRGLVVNELKDSTESTYYLLERIRERLEDLKTTSGLLGFEDVTRRLVDFWDARGTQDEAIWTHRLDANLDHLLLDEFQDTSPAQWRVIEPFARRVMQPDTLRSFFCVGDMKQAIYGWRGGVAEVFELVGQQFPELHEGKLTHSYRSSQAIISTVNQVFEKADRYASKNASTNAVVLQWKDRFDTHTTAKDELPGYAVLERIGESDDFFADVVKRIQAVYQRSPNRRIAVLTRDNDEVKRIIFRLHAAGIPASEEGGNPLTDSAAVMLILSLVQLSDHPNDSLAWFHVSHSPLAATYAIPPCRIETKESPTELRQVSDAAASVRRELGESGYGEMVARWSSVLAAHCTKRELFRLQKLIELADEYDAQATLRPSDFVEFVRREVVEDPTGSPVRVMTIHKAKGLEFDIVFLPSLSKQFNPTDHDVLVLRPSATEPVSFVTRYVGSPKRQLLPLSVREAYDQQFERGLSEAICVLYVALTRAIHSLHMFVGPKDTPARQSMAGILLATLGPEPKTDDKTPGILYEHGDRNWVDKMDSPTDSALPNALELKSPRLEDLEPPIVTLPLPDAESSRGLPTISPSRLASARRETLRSALEQASDSTAVERGSLLHACFAQIQWLDEKNWQDRLRAELRKRFPRPANWESVVDEFNAIIRQPTVSAMLRRVDYADQVARKIQSSQIIFEPLTSSVETERPFAVRLDDSIVVGMIDRWVSIHEGQTLLAAEVIEFKTDRLAGATERQIAERVGEYEPQINAYRRAVAQMTRLPLSRVFARLVMVGIDREFEVR